MTGIVSLGWRVFTDGGFKRRADGTDLAGWEIAVDSPGTVVGILFGPVTCDPRHRAFL